MLDQNGASNLITLFIIETQKRLLNTMPKDILKAQRHGSSYIKVKFLTIYT